MSEELHYGPYKKAEPTDKELCDFASRVSLKSAFEIIAREKQREAFEAGRREMLEPVNQKTESEKSD